MKWEDSYRTVEAGDFTIIQPIDNRASMVLIQLHRFRRIGDAAVVERELYPFIRAVILHAYEEMERNPGLASFPIPYLSSSSREVVL